jgi:hypothetical protein
MHPISLASNATASDGPTLLRTVPHWLRVFGSHIAEVLIVIDMEPLIGRISELQRGQSQPDKLYEAISALEASDSRVRFVSLSSLDPAPIQRRWFGEACPIRCQAGTPLLPFAATIDEAKSDIVLRCDSDMLFCERGWLLNEAIPFLQNGVDVYEPPRQLLGSTVAAVSTRAFLVAKTSLYTRLPLRNLRLDALRVLHRTISRRPPWLALEQMMTQSVKRGQLTHRIGKNTDLGFSLHGVKRAWTGAPWFAEVISAVEAGQVPAPQQRSANFDPALWNIEV